MHTSVERKTDISAVLTVTSGPDSHMMNKLDSHDTWRWNLFEVATSCFGGMTIPCWQNCYLVFLIGVNPRTTITIRIVIQKMLKTTYTN